MDFRVLGPLEVSHAGEAAPLGPLQQRALLAVLILSAPQPVSVDRLVDELWSEHPPSSARHAIQVYVSRLRRALDGLAGPEERQILRTHPSGYVLDAPPDSIDAQRFMRLLDDGQRALEEVPARARHLLEQALELWRGPPLTDLRYCQLVAAEADRLDELRVVATEALIEARLACGEDAQVVGTIMGLLAADPLRERLRRSLMVALYRSGRQAEALAAYREGHRLLDELGLQPGPALRELEQAILRHDPRLTRRIAPGEATTSKWPPPVPYRARPPRDRRFVGRQAELSAIAQAQLAASETEQHTVFVTGEPGIGKTRLVSEAARSAHAAGALVLAGRCDEELELPYQPFVEALEYLVEIAPDALWESHLRDHGATLTRLLPSSMRRLGVGAPGLPQASGAERYVLFAAVGSLLAEVSKQSSTLLVLEDLHWADVPTLLLLRHVVTAPRPARMLILCTCRLSELASSHPLRTLLADLYREPRTTRMDLLGLALPEVVELVQDLGGEALHEDAEHLGTSLQQTTGGNPFYITELMRHMLDLGTATRVTREGPGTEDDDFAIDLPRSITETLTRRVARLGTRMRDCLDLAAVIGNEFDLDLLSELKSMDAPALSRMFQRAVAAGLLVETDSARLRFGFSHALIGRWLYGELSGPRRIYLHRRVALALERRDDETVVEVAELARHWLAASRPPHVEQALRYARLAGDDALARLAPDTARVWYERALELHSQQRAASDLDRCELLLRRGEAERQAGDLRFRETLLNAAGLARRAGDSARLVRAALANTRGLQSAAGIVDHERIAELEAALDTVGEGDTPERARLVSILAMELTFSGEWERRVALSDQALAISRRLKDPATLGQVLSMRFFALWAPETHAERLANTAEAITAATSGDDPLVEFQAVHWRLAACIEAGAMAEAMGCLTRERDLAERLRQPTALWLAQIDEANMTLIAGRLADAEQHALAAYSIGEGSEPDALACLAAQLIFIRYEQGRLTELVPAIEHAVRENPGIPAFRSTLALALYEAGRGPDARKLLEGEVASGFSDFSYDVTWLAAMCGCAHVSARFDGAPGCELLYERLLPYQGLVVYPGLGAMGVVDQHLGTLAAAMGEFDTAQEHFSEALRLHESIEAPIWIARTRLEAGRMLLARGDHKSEATARDHLAQALRAANSLGCDGIARDAAALLGSDVRTDNTYV